MKKVIFSMAMLFTMLFSANAQTQTNYASNSKFTDNWSVTLQGGVLTTFDQFFAGHTACAPIIVIGADKYITPWFGLGIEGRTLIGTGTVGESRFNSHTAFDAVNISGYAKLNLANMFKYTGTRRMFEPVVYMGLGWGHMTCSNYPSVTGAYSEGWPTESADANLRNSLTARVGAELNFNLGKERAWAIVVNPSVVWDNVDNMRLCKKTGNFELTAGVVYHFKTSNGTHSFTKAKLYDQAEVNALNDEISRLRAQAAKKPAHTEAVVKTVTKTVENTFRVNFAQGSSELTDEAKAILDKVPANATVNVVGSTSPEGSTAVNSKLSNARANAVAAYLVNRGVKVSSATGDASGRMAVITVE